MTGAPVGPNAVDVLIALWPLASARSLVPSAATSPNVTSRGPVGDPKHLHVQLLNRFKVTPAKAGD